MSNNKPKKKVIEGLRVFRQELTEAVDFARDGGEVLITEIGFDRARKTGYRLTKLTDDELAAIPVRPTFKRG